MGEEEAAARGWRSIGVLIFENLGRRGSVKKSSRKLPVEYGWTEKNMSRRSRGCRCDM